MANEARLDQLREQARKDGVVTGRGVDVAGGPFPHRAGYYGQPVVKPPVWTWEIPIYFFLGGLAGMSAVIATAAIAFHNPPVARTAIWIGAAGAIASPILLILDLGRPHLFLNMLRIFKPQSAMSMGAWILTGFGACVFPALVALELHLRHVFPGLIGEIIRLAAALFILGSAVFGALLGTYTGVLLGATAIPAWYLHRTLLPIHFGTAGLGSAAGLLELLGYRITQLNALGVFAAAVESLLLIWLVIDKHGVADRAIHQNTSGWLIRMAGILTGPVSLILRLLSFVPFAAVTFLIGALVSRFGWLTAGKISGCDPESVLAAQNSDSNNG